MAPQTGRGPNDIDEDVPFEGGDETTTIKETTSLKRTREGSVEPPVGSTSQPTAITTKKNRLAPADETEEPAESSPVLGKGDLNVKPSQPEGGEEAGAGVDEEAKAEGQTVGEVRRKVEKMTYEEGAEGVEGAEGAEGVGSAEDVVEDEDLQQEGPTGADVGDEQVTDGKDEWEEIGNAEADEARASEKDKEGKELKRKALDRSESSFAKDDETVVKRAKETPSLGDELTAQPKPNDDVKTETAKPEADVDVESEPAAPAAPAEPTEPPKKPQASFGAFSSVASPFAARTASPFASAGAGASTSAFGSASTPTKSAFSGSGFGNYSSTFSPFAAKKATPAFGAGPAADKEEGKATETEAEAESGGASKAGPSTFGDILQSSKADEAEEQEGKLQMTEQDADETVPTGEEEEETVYATRVKLYIMQSDGGWRERGVGALKLNVRRSDGLGARLVMRAEGVLRLVLNVSLYVGMTCLEDGKHTGSQKVASELCGHIHDHIPLESARPSVSKSPDPEAVAVSA
ncbi:hypothetical protein EHS25_008833 [Saitozyma podzolica]|uniref:RanBD1 domain-containing protein n=1 Tax=Saitozyma podzolica TaxID=1890683 RepID=A0A427YMQ5_9TREE|nr:hypothetical protein EHS25_008833 [Saitozyma podzolica]